VEVGGGAGCGEGSSTGLSGVAQGEVARGAEGWSERRGRGGRAGDEGEGGHVGEEGGGGGAPVRDVGEQSGGGRRPCRLGRRRRRRKITSGSRRGSQASAG